MAALDGVTPSIIGAAGAAGGGGIAFERSLRFNDDDTAYLNRTPSGAGNTKTWTWSAWTKRSKITAEANLFSVGASSTDAAFRFNADDTLQVRDGNNGELTTNTPLLDPSAWYHIVVALDNLQSTAANRFRLYVNGVEMTSFSTATYSAQNAAGDFNTAVAHYIGRQVHNTSNLFDGYLTQINFVDGRQLAPTEFGEYDDNNVWQPKAYTSFNNPNASTTWSDAVPTADGFRPGRAAADAFDNDLSTYCALNNYTFNLDVGSWSTSGTLEVYTGANHEYAVDGGSTSAMNADDWTTVGDAGSITTLTLTRTDGGYPYINAVRINGYVLIDSAVDNSFQLKFDDNSSAAALGTDSSGNSNTWTVNNIATSDSLIDSPLNYTADSGNNGGNYCTWNPLDTFGPTFANGNLDASYNTTSWKGYRATIAVTSGKWYWEVTINTLSGSNYTNIGVSKAIGFGGVAINSDFDNTAETAGYNSTGAKVSSTYGGGSYGATFTAGDVIGVALDVDAGTLIFYKNNTSQGTAYSNLTANATWTPAMSMYGNVAVSANFGQRPFAYTPPTGYVSLCTENLPDPTIADGTSVLDVVNETTSVAGSSKTISGLSFAPSLVISKLRNQSANGRWGFIDIVRGVNKTLASDRTDAEVTTQTDLLTQFNSDGFDVGADAGGYGWNYQNGGSLYTYWAWDSGSSTVSNTDGTITSNVRANQSAGFSIVTYTGNATSGATVGHGLNAKPEFIIIKNRDTATYAPVYHGSLDATAPEDYWLRLFAGTDGTRLRTGPSSSAFNGTAPTSSVFSLGGFAFTNGSGSDYLAYCWAPVSQYSSFGSYTGAANLFIYTGFKPQWLLIKSYLGDGFNWVLIDSTRGATTGNVSNKLYPNLVNYQNDDGRGTETKVVFLSNGFTFLDEGAETNSSTHSYIDAAFA